MWHNTFEPYEFMITLLNVACSKIITKLRNEKVEEERKNGNWINMASKTSEK